jgi:phosphoglycolate phosphatase-like HAD superfamily hydrolase
MKILALDYDGVLVDSAKESFAVAYNLHVKRHGFKHFSNKPLSYKNFERIDTELKDLEKAFNHLRAYCSIACSFESVLAALDSKDKIKDEKDFNEFRKTINENPEFKKIFHKERFRLMNENFKSFLKLTPPHKEVIKATKKLFNMNQVFIVTKNKRELLQRVLSAYGFTVPEENVFDAYLTKSKNDGLEKIHQKTKINYKDFIVIDDHLKHLAKMAELGVKAFLADWGFASKEDLEKAKSSGIEVLNKKDFYTRIKQELL